MQDYIRPRLNDFHSLSFVQEEVDFAIPILDEDIPLYIDPFLLWKSPSMQDNSLHTALTNSFNNLGHKFVKGEEIEARNLLIRLSECREIGLGLSKNKNGKLIGEKTANDILSIISIYPKFQNQVLYILKKFNFSLTKFQKIGLAI